MTEILDQSLLYFCSLKNIFINHWPAAVIKENSKKRGTARFSRPDLSTSKATPLQHPEPHRSTHLQAGQQTSLFAAVSVAGQQPGDFLLQPWGKQLSLPFHSLPALPGGLLFPAGELPIRTHQFQPPAGPTKPLLTVWRADFSQRQPWLTAAPDLQHDHLGKPQNSALMFNFHRPLLLKNTKELPLLSLHFPVFSTRFSKQQPVTNVINSPISAFTTGAEERCQRLIDKNQGGRTCVMPVNSSVNMNKFRKVPEEKSLLSLWQSKENINSTYLCLFFPCQQDGERACQTTL